MTPKERIDALIALAPKDREERAKLLDRTVSRGTWDAHEAEVDELLACTSGECCSGGIEDALCNTDCGQCVEFSRLWKESAELLRSYLEPL